MESLVFAYMVCVASCATTLGEISATTKFKVLWPKTEKAVPQPSPLLFNYGPCTSSISITWDLL